MWKIRKQKNRHYVVLNISGRIEAAELAALQQAVSAEQSSSQSLELDLQDVRLVDQQAISFLARCEAHGTRLRNCPPYIREWITLEKVKPADIDPS
jgi:ABC-type transporter Mla MlaB component